MFTLLVATKKNLVPFITQTELPRRGSSADNKAIVVLDPSSDFRIFWNLSQDISASFVHISKIVKFLVESINKAPYNSSNLKKSSGFSQN